MLSYLVEKVKDSFLILEKNVEQIIMIIMLRKAVSRNFHQSSDTNSTQQLCLTSAISSLNRPFVFVSQQQADSTYGSENSLRRHGSMLSLTSGTSLSQASSSSFKVSKFFLLFVKIFFFSHPIPYGTFVS